MKLEALKGKNILILGTGREAQAAGKFIAPFQFLYGDDASGPDIIDGVTVLRGDDLARGIERADVIIKSPGISLYDARLRGKFVTSLMNLWFGENKGTQTICITATKGKSTTSSLVLHVLKRLGYRADLYGNIGKALCKDAYLADIAVIEVSSYQAANFDGMADIAVVLNLYEDHLDWHGTRAQYHADKLNLLKHAKHAFIGAQAKRICDEQGADIYGARIIEAAQNLPNNEYLQRPHNAQNVAAVLAITRAMGIQKDDAINAMEDFRGLLHRQFVLGEKAGILYVDDSIATTPASALAALEVYAKKPVVLIAGGYDRGIDYTPLIHGVMQHDVRGVVCLGPSGERILKGLEAQGYAHAIGCANMEEAVRQAQGFAPVGGVVLLSPAAPSFGLFTNFEARGEAFAKACGFCKDSPYDT